MFDTIVWATDGSELADSALPIVTELAQTYGSRIVAVHADDLIGRDRCSGRRASVREEEIRPKIAAQVEDLRRAGHETANVRFATNNRLSRAELIADAASQFEADLIVLASSGHGGPFPSATGGLAPGLLGRAPCPVLAVPPRSDRSGRAAALQLVAV